MGVLEGLKPESVFKYFEEISAIPRGSRNTKRISDYLVQFACDKNLAYVQDELGNVIIKKPASPGYENHDAVIIQGHMDMVCEKENWSDKDMDNEGLDLLVEDGYIKATGTTLGADDGIAVAYALAILEDKDAMHPPIEAVFTVDEEIGMPGARALDYSLLSGRKMLNADNEEEGVLLVSCAGGVTAKIEKSLSRDKKEGVFARIRISGLVGGHSGAEIDKQRANSNVLMGRTLYKISKECDFWISSINGGLKDNAIPRETEAVILLDDSAAKNKIGELINRLNEIYKKEYNETDPELTLSVLFDETSSEVTNAKETKDIITFLYNAPSGIQKMSYSLKGLPQTSLNMGILKTEGKNISFSFCVRSSVESEKDELTDRLESLAKSCDFVMSLSGSYPGWEYKDDSPLQRVFIQAYEKLFGKKPSVEAMHAGVECGFFAKNLDNLDCVSFGPNIYDIHTPREKLDILSAERSYYLRLDILKNL